MRPKTKQALDTIVDCMTGADGGASFVTFRAMIEQLDAKAAKKETAATEIIALVTRFAKLTEIATDQLKKK